MMTLVQPQEPQRERQLVPENKVRRWGSGFRLDLIPGKRLV